MWVWATKELLTEGARVRSHVNDIEGVMVGWFGTTALVDFGIEHGALWRYDRRKLEMGGFLEVWVKEDGNVDQGDV